MKQDGFYDPDIVSHVSCLMKMCFRVLYLQPWLTSAKAVEQDVRFDEAKSVSRFSYLMRMYLWLL